MRLPLLLATFAPLLMLGLLPFSIHSGSVGTADTSTFTTKITGASPVSTLTLTTVETITHTSTIAQLFSKKITERPAYPLCDKNAWNFNATAGESVVGSWSSSQAADLYLLGPLDSGTFFAWYNYREDCDPTSLPFNFLLKARNVTSVVIDSDISSTGTYIIAEVTRKSVFGRLYQLYVNLAVKSTSSTKTVILSEVYPVATSTLTTVLPAQSDQSLTLPIVAAGTAIVAVVAIAILRLKRKRT